MNDMLREMRLGLERFWRLRWLIKGPILAVLVVIAIGIISSIAGAGGGNNPAAQVLAAKGTAAPATGASATDPRAQTTTDRPTGRPTDKPTEAPAPAFLTIDSPKDGTTVASPDIVIRGSSLARAEIHRYIQSGADPVLFADDAGHWEYSATLEEGDHDFEFFLQDNSGIRGKITIIYFPAPAVSTPAPNEATAVVGEVAEFAHVRVRLNAIRDPWTSDNQFTQPAPGKRYVAFDVTIEFFNDSGTHSASPFNFGLSDARSFAYNPTFGGPEPSLNAVDLHPGEKTRGWVTFEVTNGPLQKLRYQPNFFKDTYIEFNFR